MVWPALLNKIRSNAGALRESAHGIKKLSIRTAFSAKEEQSDRHFSSGFVRPQEQAEICLRLRSGNGIR